MPEPVCYIVGAMDPGPIRLAPQRPAFVIAADLGLSHLERQGIVPDLIVGDFDSLGRLPPGENVLRYPPEKDDPDMLLAIKRGLERGCRQFVLYGGTGGRPDHAYANLQSLAYLAGRGARGYLVGAGMVSTVIQDGSLLFTPEHRGVISVFCHGAQARGVEERGLYYSLHGATLTADNSIGLSNRFTGQAAAVSVERGQLLVMWEEERERLLHRL